MYIGTFNSVIYCRLLFVNDAVLLITYALYVECDAVPTCWHFHNFLDIQIFNMD